MRTQRREWCRSALTALITVSLSVAVVAQPPGRITNRNTEFGDVNRIMEGGSDTLPGRGFGRTLSNSGKQIDYDRIDTRALRNLLTESITESESLYRSLQKDFQRSPGIRPLMSELLTVRASASRITQDIQDGISLQRVHPQLRQLDSDWRLLSHQMTQSRLLSRTSQDHLDRIDRLQRNLEKLFEMEPQLDRRAIMTQLSTIASSLRNLVQELELDPNGGTRLYELVRGARKLATEAVRVQDIVLDMYPYTKIVPEYNRFEQQWLAMVPQLRQVNNRYVDRIVRNIMNADSRMHNLLWIEQKTSRENLRQISEALSRDVDEFFNRVPLKLLLHFKNVTRILETADEFYGTVQNFKDCVARNEDDQSLLVCYQYVEEYGEAFIREFAALRSSAGRIVLREIEDDILALRNELHLAGTVTTIDTTAMLPTAATLENLADHLNFDVNQWLRRDSPSFRNEALRATASFLGRTQRIHTLLESHPTSAQLKQETADLIEEWRAVYRYLGRCDTEHREHLRVLSQDISQAIYELRAPLEL